MKLSRLHRVAVICGVDAYVLTHLHPDHFDMAADGTSGAKLDKIDTGKVLCSCENCVRNAVRAAGEALSKD